jgi:DNA-binding transcriptional MerR regulator
VEEIDYPELDSIRIPDKTHFKIGEVAKLLDLEPYVLRYWEKEFDILEPDKTDSGQRSYQRDDIELLATIEQLLYTEMFTIDGARRQLERAREGKSSYLTDTVAADGGEADSEKLEELRRENEQLREQLEARDDEFEERERDFQRERERLEGRVEELEEDLEAARDKVERLEAETRRLERESREGLSDEGRELVDALHGELDALTELAERGEEISI